MDETKFFRHTEEKGGEPTISEEGREKAREAGVEEAESEKLPTHVCSEAQNDIESVRKELIEKYKDYAATINKVFEDLHDKIAESTETDPGQVGVGVVQK